VHVGRGDRNRERGFLRVDRHRAEHEGKNDCRDASSHQVLSCEFCARICPEADDSAGPETGNAPENQRELRLVESPSKNPTARRGSDMSGCGRLAATDAHRPAQRDPLRVKARYWRRRSIAAARVHGLTTL
jgi:hypothetical protein